MNFVVKIVQPSGILDEIKGQQLRQEISNIVQLEVDIILIDLQSVNFMSSSGLGALVLAQKMLQAAGVQLFLCSVNEQVKMLFNLTRMNRFFEIFANQDEFNSKLLSRE